LGKGADLLTSKPVVFTYPLFLALATGLSEALSSLWNKPVVWAWVTALLFSAIIYGLDWLSNRSEWDRTELLGRLAIFLPLNTIILALSQTNDFVRNLLTQGQG
jgi:hypothetical protein